MAFCTRYDAAKSDEYFKEIQSRYALPVRFYHTFEGHIGSGLEDLARYGRLCEDKDMAYFAWVLHDVIQDTHRKDNEEESAIYACDLAARMGLPERFQDKERILATRHDEIPSENDSRLIVCLDLLIFAKSPDVYDEYRRNVTLEYKDIIKRLSPKEFAIGRAGIITRFEKRRPLYPIPEIEEEYGDKARENLRRELRELGFEEI